MDHTALWNTAVNVAHTAAKDADFADITAYYEGKILKCGDMHAHSKFSDNHHFTMKELTEQMPDVGLDLMAFADHNNWYQAYAPYYDATKHMPVMEITTLKGDFNVYFKDKKMLKKLARFLYKGTLFLLGTGNPEEKEKGYWDSVIYKMIKAHGINDVPNSDFYPQYMEFAKSLGGLVSLNHPMCNIGADEQSFLVTPRLIDGKPNMKEWLRFDPNFVEVVNGSFGAPWEGEIPHNKNAVLLWLEYLRAGRKVYCIAGTDTHGAAHGNACAHLYTDGAEDTDVFDTMEKGCFSIGKAKEAKVRTMLNGTPMGGTVTAKDGDLLKIEVIDATGDTQMIVHCGDGIAYNETLSPVEGVIRVALPIKAEQRFYLVELRGAEEKHPIGFSNPIFVEGE